MKYHHAKNGFSLVEVLVYLAVVVLLAGAIITSIFSLVDVFSKNSYERELTDAAAMTLERISREAHSASGFDLGSSLLNISPGAVALVNGPTTTEFYVSNGRVILEVNDVVLGPLTPENVSVDGLMFHRLNSTSSEALRVTLTLSIDEGTASTTMIFHTAAVLRNTYE